MSWRPRFPGERPTLGHSVIEWIEDNLAAPDRDGYEPFVLSREQAEFVLRLYEVDPQSGRRVIRRAVLSRPRGWGKSPFLACLCLVEGLADVVPDGWDSSGRPVGRPWSSVRTPLVQLAAVSEEQARRNTWTPLLEMLDPALDPPVLDNYPGLEPLDTFVNLPRGQIAYITASGSTAKGNRPVFQVWDQALAIDTPIPTPRGWVTMGDLRHGDLVFGSSGRPVRVVAAKPVMYGRDCYRVTFSDKTSVVADAGHLWWAKPAPNCKLRTVRTVDMMDGRRWHIPAAPAREMPETDLACPPYLLGYWLGDGTRNKAELTVSEADVDEVQGVLAGEGVVTSPRRYVSFSGWPAAVNLSFTHGGGYQASRRPEYVKALQRLACYRDKSAPVPAEYRAGSIAQRTALLQGLMDSDGSVTPKGVCWFISTSRVLADLVTELLRSLGQVTSGPRRVVSDRYTNGGIYRVTFTPRGGLVPFRLGRKVSRAKGGRAYHCVSVSSIVPVESVPVRCIAVDAEDRLFAFGEAGHLTHNTEAWLPGNGGVRLARVLADNAAKVGSAYVETPNAYTPGEGSVAEATAGAWRAIQEGRARVDRGLLYDHREAPPETDLTDQDSLLAGLRFAYGDSSADPRGCVIHDPACPPGWADHDAHIARIWDPDADEQGSRGNFLNQITHASDAWLSAPEWAARRDTSKQVVRSDAVTLGFDGSRGRAKGKPDATALVACRVSDGHMWPVAIWEADDAPSTWDGWEPPLSVIEETIDRVFREHNVVGFYCDPARDWRSYVNGWEAKHGGKVLVRESRDHPFEWWMTGGRSIKIERAVEQLEAAIRNGDMTHSGHDGLTRHMLNSRRRVAHGRLTLGKESSYSARKIDAAIAGVLAWQARLDAVAAGAGQTRKTSTRFGRIY